MTGVFAGPGLSALDDWLPLFTGVVAMTSNSVAEICESGAYAQPSRSGSEILEVARRVGLRASTRFAPQLRLASVAAGARPGLELLAEQQVLHRCSLTGPRDPRLLTAMAVALPRTSAAPTVPEADWAATAWTCEASGALCFARLERATRREHLDALLCDGGPARHALLAHSRQQLTEVIGIDQVRHLFARLRLYRASMVVAVVVPGLLQLGSGMVGAVDLLDGTLVAEVGAATVAVELADVAECRVVWPAEGAAMVELYDHSDHCVALLTGAESADLVDRARWDHVVEMACL